MDNLLSLCSFQLVPREDKPLNDSASVMQNEAVGRLGYLALYFSPSPTQLSAGSSEKLILQSHVATIKQMGRYQLN